MAGAMGYGPVESLAHAFEDALGCLRDRDGGGAHLLGSAPHLSAALDALDDAVEARLGPADSAAGDGGTAAVAALRAHADAPAAPPRPAADVAGPALAPAAARTLSVDLAALDCLLDLAGELAAVRERLARAAAHSGDAALARAVADVARVSHAVTGQVRTARLVAVGELFDELPRVVRAAARASGKLVALDASGGGVVADRAVIDALAEPLTHLLRNAVDHGLETPAERERAGKPADGRVAVRALREGNALVVEVEDDGRGVDRDAVVARARGRLPAADAVAPGAPVDDATLLACLALPGLTTARSVGRVSGRGVGVDAALARVRALGGALTLRTVAGQGTRFTLRMPLSWSVIPSLLVRAGGATYALPLAHVRGTRAAEDGAADPLALAELVGAATAGGAAHGGAELVTVAGPDGAPIDLAVDALLGTADCVLKPLAAPRGAIRVAVGATILDGGDVVLVLDVPGVVARRAAPAPADTSCPPCPSLPPPPPGPTPPATTRAR